VTAGVSIGGRHSKRGGSGRALVFTKCDGAASRDQGTEALSQDPVTYRVRLSDAGFPSRAGAAAGGPVMSRGRRVGALAAGVEAYLKRGNPFFQNGSES